MSILVKGAQDNRRVNDKSTDLQACRPNTPHRYANEGEHEKEMMKDENSKPNSRRVSES